MKEKEVHYPHNDNISTISTGSTTINNTTTNTATTSKNIKQEDDALSTNGSLPDPDPASHSTRVALRNMCFLATAYAANIGGTGSLTGTTPNLVMNGILARSGGFVCKRVLFCVVLGKRDDM